ncbi:hypothetical protein DYB28_000676 [Aphanomyces astaci]|uniref:Tc1-like transposase DDE domain-containing protein n=1 Tax=Aphanomyces astaci TaxID=112090 RepID=A0A9X8HD49_APHAT|nr:hypothetical protein DYB28_000676 [Aphanomyces astaci]
MDPSIDACFAFVKTARHRTVTREERLDILRLHAWFRSQYTKASSKQVAHALGRNLVQDVWREYQASQTVTAATPSGNRTTHITKGPRTKLVTQMVQQFVRDRRATRTRTTAVEVMMYLKEICVLDIDVDDKKQFAASYRAVQRFLKAQGYKRGHRKGSSTYHLSKANALARDTKEKHKGRRYCFVAGILDSPTMASKVMALDIFTGGKSRGKEPKDYHGMFDHAYYVKWFGRLLDEMHASGVTKALIVLDNAKYHKGLRESTPTSGRRKSILLDAYHLCGIQTTGKEFKSELWDMLASHIKAHIHPVIVEMAKRRGH